MARWRLIDKAIRNLNSSVATVLLDTFQQRSPKRADDPRETAGEGAAQRRTLRGKRQIMFHLLVCQWLPGRLHPTTTPDTTLTVYSSLQWAT